MKMTKFEKFFVNSDLLRDSGAAQLHGDELMVIGEPAIHAAGCDIVALLVVFEHAGDGMGFRRPHGSPGAGQGS